MLNELDESLEAFLRASVPLPEHEVDVSFDAPDRDWGAHITRPTVNLFLWDLRRNVNEQDGGLELHADGGGRQVWSPPLPRIDCRYLVTAWTSEVGDEHSLLGAVLRACLLTSEIGPQYLMPRNAEIRPLPSLRVGMPDGKDTADFWSALGGQLKPGLDVVVTVTVDAAPTSDAGPPVERYELTAHWAAEDARVAVNDGKSQATERRVWIPRNGDIVAATEPQGPLIVPPE